MPAITFCQPSCLNVLMPLEIAVFFSWAADAFLSIRSFMKSSTMNISYMADLPKKPVLLHFAQPLPLNIFISFNFAYDSFNIMAFNSAGIFVSSYLHAWHITRISRWAINASMLEAIR